MKKLYALWFIFSSLSFCSCQPETTQTKQATPHTNNIVYLHQLVTRSDEAKAQFNTIISMGKVVVDFYADWCGPCRSVSTAINQIAPQFPDVTFLKVNIDELSAVARGIKSIPVIRLYKDGCQVYSKPGAKSVRELTDLLKQYF